MKFGILNLLLVAVISGCGGGGESPQNTVIITKQDISTNIKGDACNLNSDSFGSINFITVHPINERPYGCLIVDKKDGYPVVDGSKSARFEVRPWDCSGSDTYDDCKNDRSRHEIIDNSIFNGSTNGSTIIYSTDLYIPYQTSFKPKGIDKWHPILFLAQIITSGGPSGFNTLAFLEVSENQELMVRAAWPAVNPEQTVLTANIFDRWINVRYEVKSSHTNGYVKIYVDNQLKYEKYQPTLLDAVGANGIKLGIYNAFKSGATESYQTQVIYYDRIGKILQ